MLQELNVVVHGHKPEWIENSEVEKRKAIIHVQFCCELYEYQFLKGRHFLHEHPWSARSWALPCVQKLLINPSVDVVQGHMCLLRMTTHIDTKEGKRRLVKKPSGFMSRSRCVRNELNKKCTGGHAHVSLVGGRAAGAQVYPQALCEAVCRGVSRQQEEDAALGFATGKTSMDEVRQFAHYNCNLSDQENCNINRVQSIIENEDKSSPIGDYPQHWIDAWHELEGGSDAYRVRPQYGATLL